LPFVLIVCVVLAPSSEMQAFCLNFAPNKRYVPYAPYVKSARKNQLHQLFYARKSPLLALEADF
jgi:hypothetical protein